MSSLLLMCAILSKWVYDQPHDDTPLGFTPTITSERVVLFEDDRVCVVAYRGTDSVADFFDDIRSQSFQHCDTESGMLKEFEKSFHEIDSGVHRRISERLRHCDSVYFTGHSLGAAMSLIAPSAYGVEKNDGIVTFGGPKVCCDGKHMRGVTRVVNKRDPIPALPISLEVSTLSHCGDFMIELPSKEHIYDYNLPTLPENYNLFDHRIDEYVGNLMEYINTMRTRDV